jgi:hypothetical protein
MDNINSLLTPAIDAYSIALIYRYTRTSCLSSAALCPWVTQDALNRLLHIEVPWSGRLWQLVTSRLVKADPSPVKKHYRMRQQIGETIRLLKQEFGWGGSSVREAKAEVAHPHLGLMAMCLAQRKMGVCLILVPQRILLSSKYPLLSD